MQNSKLESGKIVNATKWSLFTEFAIKLVSPIVNIILARILLPEAFGAITTINLVISFADMFTDSGFQKYIIQHEFESDNKYTNSVAVAFWSNLFISAAIVCTIVLFKDRIAIMVGSPELSDGIAVASLSILISTFISIHTATYRRTLDFKSLFFLRCVSAIIPFVVTIPMALIMRNFWALVIGTICNNAIQAIILCVRPKVKIRFLFSFTLFREMFSFASFTLLETLSIWLTTNVDIFIIGRVFDNYSLGIYKTSMQTVNSYMNIISGAISTVLFATLSRMQFDDIRYKKTFNAFQKKFAIIILPMGIGLFVFRDLATQILLGSNWIGASEFIGLWAIVSSYIAIIGYFSSEVFRSKGKPLLSFAYQMIQVIILIPVIYISCMHGLRSTYIARCCIAIEMIITSIIFLKLFFGFRIKQIIKNLYIQIMCSLIMGICGYFIKNLFDNVVWQLFSVFLCIVIYFMLIYLSPLRNDLIMIKELIISRFIKRRGKVS